MNGSTQPFLQRLASAEGMRVGFREKPSDLFLVAALSAVLSAVAAIGLGGVAGFVAGFVLVLVLPGYAIMAALFPAAGEITWLQRLTLSVGLGIAAVSLVGLLSNFAPWGIHVGAIIVILDLGTVGLSAVAYVRRQRGAGRSRARLHGTRPAQRIGSAGRLPDEPGHRRGRDGNRPGHQPRIHVGELHAGCMDRDARPSLQRVERPERDRRGGEYAHLLILRRADGRDQPSDSAYVPHRPSGRLPAQVLPVPGPARTRPVPGPPPEHHGELTRCAAGRPRTATFTWDGRLRQPMERDPVCGM